MGLRVKTIKAGGEYRTLDGKDVLKVEDGKVHIEIFGRNPEDYASFWKTVESLEEKSQDS